MPTSRRAGCADGLQLRSGEQTVDESEPTSEQRVEDRRDHQDDERDLGATLPLRLLVVASRSDEGQRQHEEEQGHDLGDGQQVAGQLTCRTRDEPQVGVVGAVRDDVVDAAGESRGRDDEQEVQGHTSDRRPPRYPAVHDVPTSWLDVVSGRLTYDRTGVLPLLTGTSCP